MTPTYNAGDVLLFNRLDRNVEPQDIVVLKKNGMRYVARVAAVSGDTVDIPGDGSVYINGSLIDEPYINTSTLLYKGYTEFPLTLGENECFVLSDNREGGNDSRYFGIVSKNEITGTVLSLVRRSRL